MSVHEIRTVERRPLQSLADFNIMETPKRDGKNVEESFYSPSANTFDEAESRPAQPAGQYRESLYVRFDPLFESKKAQTPQQSAPAVATGKLLDLMTPVASHYAKGASPAEPSASTTPTGPTEDDATPKPIAQRYALDEPLPLKHASLLDSTPVLAKRYTEEEVKKLIDAAVKQSKEENLIAQMEIEELNSKVKELQGQNAQMTNVVEEYTQAMEAMIKSQQGDTGSLTAKIEELKREKATLEEDLRATETGFNNLHGKYERTKGLIENLKSNETKLKAALESAQSALAQAEERYGKLKAHAETKIHTANEEIATVREEYKAQLATMSSKLKKSEIIVQQLERRLEVKDGEIKELTAICDDLVKQLEVK